mgnify:CR=1 FL=1
MFKIPRINAFLLHFAISFVVFLIPAYLIFFHWYPLPYFYSDGGWRGIKIIAGVYLVLGPLLTLIVYKPGKPGLKLDLTLIGLAQAAALTWGIWVTYNERPVAIVYALDYFSPVPAKSLSNLAYPIENLALYGNKKPVPVYVNLPENIEEQQPFLAQSVRTKTPLYLFTDLYTKFDLESLQILKQNSDKLYALLESDEEGKQLLNTFFQSHPELYNRCLFIPLHSRYKRLIIVLDASDLSYKDTLDISVTDFLHGIKHKESTTTKSQDN